jgi:hypothetical protein
MFTEEKDQVHNILNIDTFILGELIIQCCDMYVIAIRSTVLFVY